MLIDQAGHGTNHPNDNKIGIPLALIITVLRDGPIIGKTNGVGSEKVVRSGHSTQSYPETIEEARRILRQHIEAQ